MTAAKSKICSAEEAVRLIRSNSVLVVAGSGGGVNEPDAVLKAFEERFMETGQPQNIILYHPNGLGDGEGRGTDRFAHDGLLKMVYGSHWSWAPKLSRMALESRFNVAVWPQGVLSQLLREMAANRPGLITQIGIGTYLDPRVNARNLPGSVMPRVIEVDGNTFLYYSAPPPNAAIIRATTADEAGNLTFEHEGVVLDALGAAMAAHRNGGLVIAQVKRVAKAGTLDPLLVRVPRYLVDCVVVDPGQRQSRDTDYNPAYSGELRMMVPPRSATGLERLVIARRAALELRDGDIVNLGFGIADSVAAIAQQEPQFKRDVTFTLEQGVSGGIPAWDRDFGLMWNPEAILDAPNQFDFYDGGGLDIAIVSFAEVNSLGDVNVSRFGDRLIGPGGFMNITGASRRVVFCGTLTAKGLDVAWDGKRLHIRKEGAIRKFTRSVNEVTFSGSAAQANSQSVMYITERAVFRLSNNGLELVEIAPGVSVPEVISNMEFEPKVSSDLKQMPDIVFSG